MSDARYMIHVVVSVAGPDTDWENVASALVERLKATAPILRVADFPPGAFVIEGAGLDQAEEP